MKANTKKLLVAGSIIGALAIVATAIAIRSKRKKLEKKILEGSPDIVLPAATTTSSVIFPLKIGAGTTVSERNAVKLVQRYLNAKLIKQWWLQLAPLNEDGIFGPLTENVLKNVAGVKEVSYSFYKEMQNFLYKVPELLSPNTPSYKPYKAPDTDPEVQKNDLSIFKILQ